MRNRWSTATVCALAVLALAGIAHAQLRSMGMPVQTNLVVFKPAPGQTYAGQQTVTMGVGDKVYKFVLKDGNTNSLKVKWPDIWQYVQQFNPNFVVQGPQADTFAKVEPGETVKVQGMFAPLDRTFEVVNVEKSGGGAQHY